MVRSTGTPYFFRVTARAANVVLYRQELPVSAITAIFAGFGAAGMYPGTPPFSTQFLRFYPEFWIGGALLLGGGVFFLLRHLRAQVRNERILTYFATSLYGRNTVEDVFWDIAENCISQLGFEDCVIYQYDDNLQVLVQKAAYGPKNPEKRKILNPILIPLGKGITGHAALLRKPVRVGNTSRDSRYILDDCRRQSELAVPIFLDGKVFGVIDTEHRKKHFYTRQHIRILQKIAGLCSEKLTRYLAEEKIRASIARDLHDEMGSALTSINILSKIAIEQQNPDQTYDYLRRINENSRQMMETMSDMVWTIHPENDSVSKMIVRLKEFAAEMLDPTGTGYRFLTEEATETVRLDLNQRKEIYLITKEALTNAAKYSGAKQVVVEFRMHNGRMQVRIGDNGNGFIPGQASHGLHSGRLHGGRIHGGRIHGGRIHGGRIHGGRLHGGNGLKNMQHRAERIGASLSIHSAPGQGTEISLELDIT